MLQEKYYSHEKFKLYFFKHQVYPKESPNGCKNIIFTEFAQVTILIHDSYHYLKKYSLWKISLSVVVKVYDNNYSL